MQMKPQSQTFMVAIVRKTDALTKSCSGFYTLIRSALYRIAQSVNFDLDFEKNAHWGE
jgi:hypothetical protein